VEGLLITVRIVNTRAYIIKVMWYVTLTLSIH